MEISIDPTAGHGADLGLVPIVLRDACGAGHNEAAERALANIGWMGDAIVTDAATFAAALRAAG
jgi:biuret amidohydrolase